MFGMTSLDDAILGGGLDQVVALDFVLNLLFDSDKLTWLAHTAAWLTIALTIALPILALLRRALRILDAMEKRVALLRRGCRLAFWTLIGNRFKALAEKLMRMHDWAMSKR